MSAPKGMVPWNKGMSKGWLDKRGYRWIYVTENGHRRARREHRVIMERYLDRRLEPWEEIHHINGDAADNRLENLEIIAHDAHTIQHHIGSTRPEALKRASTVFGQMREEIRELRRTNADLLAAVEAVEWVEHDEGFQFCPACHGRIVHAKDCRTATALQKARGNNG